MRRLRQQFPDTLVVVGVHSAKFPAEKPTAAIREAVLRHGIQHPVVNDAAFQIWQQHAIRAWPTVVLVDAHGKIVASQSGEVVPEELAPEIQRLVNEADSAGILNRAPLDLALPAEEDGQPRQPLRFPSKILATSGRRIFVADTGHHRVVELQIDRDGRRADIVRIFGNGTPALRDGPAGEAAFHEPRGLALVESRLYVADTGNHAVRAIQLGSGQVRTVAGTGYKAHGAFELGPPLETPLRSPWALAAVEDLLFIAMAGSHQIWVLMEETQIGPFAGNGREALVDGPRAEASFNQPSDLALGLDHLFVADAEASAVRAIRLNESPKVFTLVGQGLFEFGDLDGRGAEVRLQHPVGLAFEGGLLYVADTYNHKVKTLDPRSGEVKTLFGAGQAGRADGLYRRALLNEPEGLAIAGRTLYVADTNNHVLRAVDLDRRLVHTLEVRDAAGGTEVVASPAARGTAPNGA